MKRRDFVAGTLFAAGMSACEPQNPAEEINLPVSQDIFEWNMVTSWPPGLPGLGVGATNFAKRAEKASGGRLKIKVFAGGELVPPLEVFDAVSRGTVQMGHDSSYYHRGKVSAAPYYTTVPFGLNVNEMNAWLYYGDGLDLWHELYAPFNLVPFPVGNTGVQMLGWFNKKIQSINDLSGMKIRMPGLGGEIMQRAGAIQVTVPGSEIFTSLKTGVVDAAEWVGPYNDIALGLHKAARYYYYPGFHEPGPNIECIINKTAWNTLPEDLQEIVRVVSQACNLDMTSEYMWGNAIALDQLKMDPNVELIQLPQEVFDELRMHSIEAINDLSQKDDWAKKIEQSISNFMKKSSANQKITELAYLNMRINNT